MYAKEEGIKASHWLWDQHILQLAQANYFPGGYDEPEFWNWPDRNRVIFNDYEHNRISNWNEFQESSQRQKPTSKFMLLSLGIL